MTDHLPDTTVAAYADGRLGRDERRRVEAHLAGCTHCRDELIEVSRLVVRRRRLPPMVPLGAAAAIGLIAISIAAWPHRNAVILRGDEPRNALEVSVPRDGALVSDPVAFAWTPSRGALEYRLTLTNDAGDILAERIVADTSTTVTGLSAATYRWYVATVTSDGAALSSRIRSFTVR